MRRTRVYHEGPLQTGQVVTLAETSARHLRTVLRLKNGQPLILFNGQGGEFTARIHSLDKHSLEVEIGQHDPVDRESPLKITLAQGISKGQRMDYSLQKAVELGVHALQPVWTEHCAVRQKGDRQARKEQHWQGVITSAAEQSGRTLVPELLPALRLQDYLIQTDPSALKLVLDPQADRPISESTLRGRSVHILVGPEGGLSVHEIEHACAQGFQGIRMGPRILRTETAGAAAIAILQSLGGGM